MNVYLVGMMGSGKSSTGQALASLLDLRFVDVDREIQKSESAAVAEIFEKKGEPYFREAESRELERVSRESGQVVATGGGVVLKESNIRVMRRTGKIVYLKTSVDWLVSRLAHDTERPLLKGEDLEVRLGKLARQRASYYDKAGDFVFVTDGKTPEAVAVEISASGLLNEKNKS
ncbi:MAG TPA: shikimate kinase [Verrucomicrobiae bacterium]|nr:shikimate kinase [Verrucomicrobiae bacterium]